MRFLPCFDSPKTRPKIPPANHIAGEAVCLIAAFVPFPHALKPIEAVKPGKFVDVIGETAPIAQCDAALGQSHVGYILAYRIPELPAHLRALAGIELKLIAGIES